MINKLLIILLILLIIFNLSQYENFDNNNFNKHDLEKYDVEINKNLEILNNLIKKIKSKGDNINTNKDRKISKVRENSNRTFADKDKVHRLFKNAGLTK